MPFWPINVQSLCLLYFFVWFYLIRTQAFSVFSKMSSHVATPRWDGTTRQKCPSLKQWPCEQKTAARGWLCVHSSNTSSCFLSTPFSLKKKKNQPRVHLLRLIGLSFCNLYFFIASLPLAEVFFVRRRHVSGQLSLAAASSVFSSLKAQQASVHRSSLVSKQSPSDFWGETEPSWTPRWHERVFVLFS